MSPDQFLAQIQRSGPAPVYLFLGPEPYMRDVCRQALLQRLLPAEERQDGYVRHDLDTASLLEVIDDARSLSLFAPRRLLWIASAEAALPRGRAAAADDDEPGSGRDGDSGQSALAAYLKDPTPDTVVVIDAQRFEMEGEEKAKFERVQKYYAAVPQKVEFARFSPQSARRLALELARAAGLDIDGAEISLLVDAVGEDAARIALEIEKLTLYKAGGGKVTAEDIAGLVPSARAANIFALVNALGRNDRARALDLLDTLVREGEYLPLALTFLATQFRQALAASEEGLRSPQQIIGYYRRLGLPMWPSRAEQISQTLTQFTPAQMRKAITRVFQADHALRDARPDDRIIMEEFVWSVTR